MYMIKFCIHSNKFNSRFIILTGQFKDDSMWTVIERSYWDVHVPVFFL